MYKFSKNSIPKVFSIVGLILIFLIIVSHFLSTKTEPENPTQITFKLISQLKDRWELGDIENHFHKKKFTCDKLIFNAKNIDSEFLKCNPNYLECFLNNETPINSEFSIVNNGKKYSLKIIKNNNQFFSQYQNSINLNAQIIGLDLGVFRIKLQNTCNEVLLPQRIYSAGEVSDNSQVWDNLNQQIYIDKFYVSNLDIYHWDKSKLDHLEPKKFHLPNTSLSINERKNYCLSKRKQLLQSHVLDAASFIPSDLSDSIPEFVYKYPYSWTKKKKGVFLYESLDDSDYEVKAKDCEYAYVADCLKIVDYKHFATDSVSWMGINNILGHYLEFVENKFLPSQNLKASSFYFNAKSAWHEVGKRASWDGVGYLKSNFDFGEFSPVSASKYEVAFRCMRYGKDK